MGSDALYVTHDGSHLVAAPLATSGQFDGYAQAARSESGSQLVMVWHAAFTFGRPTQRLGLAGVCAGQLTDAFLEFSKVLGLILRGLLPLTQ